MANPVPIPQWPSTTELIGLTFDLVPQQAVELPLNYAVELPLNYAVMLHAWFL